MSDTGIDTGGAPAPSPADTSSSSSDDLFANPVEDSAVVSRGFAENLRAEGLKYRTDLRSTQEQLNAYEAVYGGFTPEDRNVWFDIARTWQSDPTRAAAMMKAISDAVIADNGGGEGEPPPEPPPGTPPPNPEGLLTPEQVQQMIDAKLGERDQRSHEDQMVNEVLAEVRAEGFDPEDVEGFMVLWTASNQTNGDVKAAAEKMRAYRQSIVDNYVSGRANGPRPAPSSPNGTPGSELPTVGSWDEIRKGAAKFMEAASGNGLS